VTRSTDISTPRPAEHAPGYKAIRFNLDWITRPLFGIMLAGAAVAAIFGGPPYIALFAIVASVAAAREYHRMVGEAVYGAGFFITSVAIAAALAAQVLWPHALIGVAIVALGALVIGVYALFARLLPLWQGFGPLYIGTAPLAMIVLRGQPHGAWIIIGMFLAIWATDTGALIIGNLIGGPRLWPALSPNKTWSGTLGAVATAAIVEAIYIAVLHGNPVFAGILGAAIAGVAHCGDLFESWIKRIFQRKDSGALIPGHGGVLDRIDSTLAAAPILAALVLFAGLNPLFGAQP
jgi:phosphatidate cytidylyltransferase